MNWFIIRHPETSGVAVVAESALTIHKGSGWIRVSEAIAESAKDQIVTQDHAAAPDLDAQPAVKNKVFVKESGA